MDILIKKIKLCTGLFYAHVISLTYKLILLDTANV